MKQPTAEQLKGNGETIPTMEVYLRGSEYGELVRINAHEYNPEEHEKPGERGSDGSDLDSMSKKELEEHLTTAGVAFAKSANKDALLALAKEHAGQ